MSLLIYLLIAYGASLTLYPLGRDYELLHNAARHADPLVSALIAQEISLFGTHVVPYHLVNLSLLYAAMLSLYGLTRLVVRDDPIWLGTLAATLFMANPVHGEATLNLLGVVDLLPALFAIAALTLYAWSAEHPSFRAWAGAWILFIGAQLFFQVNMTLFLVLGLYEVFVLGPRGKASIRRALVYAATAAPILVFHAQSFTSESFRFGPMFSPLYFILYPIGFLPESAQRFHETPWLGWLAALAVVCGLFLVYQIARNPVILFGVFAACVLRLGQGAELVDPVHLIGGGSLIVPTALLTISMVALFRRIMDHPKWRKTTVTLTTGLCVLLFGMQIRNTYIWRTTAVEVRGLQAQAKEKLDPNRPVWLAPDYQYHNGAPLRLSLALKYETPFSKAYEVRSVIPLHYDPDIRPTVNVEKHAGGQVQLTISHPSLSRIAPWPFDLLEQGHVFSTAQGEVTVESVTGDRCRLRVSRTEQQREVQWFP